MNSYSLSGDIESPARTLASDPLPPWCAFLLGGVVTFFLIYVGISRPMRRDLDLLNQQVGGLRATLDQLVALKPGAKAASDLMTSLSNQQRNVAAAAAGLRTIQALFQAIESRAVDVNVATESLADLTRLKDTVLLAGERVQEANNVLTKAEVLQERLAEADEVTTSAIATGTSMLELSDTLAQRRSSVAESRAALENMFEVQDELRAKSGDLEGALEKLQDLLLLKDTLLARTNNLVDAIETLELSAELTRNFQQATQSFEEIRQWLFEVVAAEPIMEQARRVLSPLMEAHDLRRMDASQLRAVAQGLREQWPATIAERATRTAAVDNFSDDVDWDEEDSVKKGAATR
ncbi:MAG TPA: hypothetical protein VIY86_11215 [Pirellulaceae bacterium]